MPRNINKLTSSHLGLPVGITVAPLFSDFKRRWIIKNFCLEGQCQK